jgi:hypothetical protein
MINVGQLLQEYFEQFLVLIGLVIWGVRLEGRINQQDKIIEMHNSELKTLDDKLVNFDSKLLLKLSEIAERLSFIEGSLRKGHDE